MKYILVFLMLAICNGIDAQNYYEKYFNSGVFESGASITQFRDGLVAVSGFSQRSGRPISGMTILFDGQLPLLVPVDDELAYVGGLITRTGNDDSWIMYQMNDRGVISPFLEEGDFFFDQTLREVYSLQDKGVVLTGGSSTTRIGMMARFNAVGNQTWRLGFRNNSFRVFLGDMEQIGANYLVSGVSDDGRLNWNPLIISVSSDGDLTWSNEYKLHYSVPSYLFRFENFNKGLKNEHIMKSTFGRKSLKEIKEEINYWFNNCIGAYNQIEFNL